MVVAPPGPTQEWYTSEEDGISVGYNTRTGQSYIGGYELPADSPNVFDLGREMRWTRTALGKDFPDGTELDGSYSLEQLLGLALNACSHRKSLACSNELIGVLFAAHFAQVGPGSDRVGHQFAAGRAGGPPVPMASVSRPPYRKGCDPNSFRPDTLVLMADGSTKRIDEVEVGDQVLAADPESGESGGREVTATLINKGIKFLVEIETAGGKITATQQHPFWLPEETRWADARELRVGSSLLTAAGARVWVSAIKKRVVIQRVYNLTVAGLHTYHVISGSTPILVHNTCTDEDSHRIEVHVNDRHTSGGSKNKGKSVFNDDEDLLSLAQKSTAMIGRRQANTGRVEYVIDAGRVVGQDVRGINTNVYTVIRTSRREMYDGDMLELGDLVTMHPGAP